MKVLVTGGSGFIGSHLCAALQDRGHTVTAMSRNPDETALPAGVDSVEGDVTEFDDLPDIVRSYDAVAHLVALSPLYRPKGGEEQHEHITVGGTRNVVRAMSTANVDRLLYLSALGADAEANTTNLRSKWRAEEIIRSTDLDWTVVRPSAVFGEGGEFLSFVRMVTTPYITGLPGGGTMRFQPIWIGDLVPMLATALESNEHIESTYELGGPDILTLADVTKLLYESNNTSVRIVPIPMLLTRIGMTVGSFIPLFPFGPDQYHSLTLDNSTTENAAGTLGMGVEDLCSLQSYLAENIGEAP